MKTSHAPVIALILMAASIVMSVTAIVMGVSSTPEPEIASVSSSDAERGGGHGDVYSPTTEEIEAAADVVHDLLGDDVVLTEPRGYAPSRGFTIGSGDASRSVSFHIEGFTYDDAEEAGWTPTGETFSGIASLMTTIDDSEVVIFSTGRISVRTVVR